MLKIYKDPKRFWAEVAPWLKREEAKHSLCLGLSLHFCADATDWVYQSALFQKEQLLGALVCSRYRTNRNFLPTQVQDPAHAQELFAGFQKANLPITGIVGELKTATLYKGLFEAAGHKIKINVAQGIYRCSRVWVPGVPQDIKFRPAGLRDVDKIGTWIEDFHREALPHDPPVSGQELAEAKIKKGMIYVLEKKGRLVAMAGWGRDIESSCSINLVFTPKPWRKNGYGSVITALLTKHFLDQGKIETNLYTDMNNPTSNKIYQNIGYQFVCDSVHMDVR
ncbi:MAG: GNAT family N-acetyltransferase [Bdellovibrionales bacterium]